MSLHEWELWWIRQPGFDPWVQHTQWVHDTTFRLGDREGLARIFADSYVRDFLATAAADVPVRRLHGHPVQVTTPEAIVLMVSWVCERKPDLAAPLRARLVALFSAFKRPPPWALEVEREVFAALDRVIAQIARPN